MLGHLLVSMIGGAIVWWIIGCGTGGRELALIVAGVVGLTSGFISAKECWK